MAVELTGPDNCAECGIELADPEKVAALTFTVEGHQVEIPGLYRCMPCTEALAKGELESTVTMEAAGKFLTRKFIPHLVGCVNNHQREAEEAFSRFADCLAVVEILGLAGVVVLIEQAADEDSEVCTCEAQMATLN